MKTSELLVYVLVFLFGYMLFKRCGCRSVEGIETNALCSIELENKCGGDINTKYSPQKCANCTTSNYLDLKVNGCKQDDVDNFCPVYSIPISDSYGGNCPIKKWVYNLIDINKLSGTKSITKEECESIQSPSTPIDINDINVKTRMCANLAFNLSESTPNGLADRGDKCRMLW
jgi:hypothetical protein